MTESNKNVQKHLRPSFGAAMLLVVISMTLIGFAVLKFETAPQIPLIVCTVLASLFGLYYGYRWDEIQEAFISGVTKAFASIMILMMVGTVIGAWILDGTVPALIYYGLQIFAPETFLTVTVIICAVVSLATGSSWTTIGTIGVAIIGIAQGLGIPLPITVGAIVSGAFFGDKMSPLSDTTNLAPAVSGANIFDHIRHMIYTVAPAMVISLILYMVIGRDYGQGSANIESINAILTGIEKSFYISPILLFPPAVVLTLAFLKKPALPTLFIGAFLGCVFAVIFQEASIAQIINTVHFGFKSKTGVEFVDKLLSRGGLQNMLFSVSLIIIALGFGGILERVRVLEVVLEKMANITNKTGHLVLTNVLTCLGLNVVLGEQYLSVMLPGRMFAEKYKAMGLAPKNLSRVLEDSGTLFNGIIPWGLSGTFIFSTLGVSAFEYAPYAFLCLITPVISVLYGYTGFTMEKISEQDEENSIKELKEVEV